MELFAANRRGNSATINKELMHMDYPFQANFSEVVTTEKTTRFAEPTVNILQIP